jgi:nucleotide-binding universal stress UspA family protein
MYRKILVANDGSDGASKAMGAALELAKRLGAELHMISVEELPRFPTSVDEIVEDKSDAGRFFKHVVGRARTRAAEHGIGLQVHVVPGHAVPSIVEFVDRERFDLLVVGFMGHSALYNRLIGGTTDRLVELAPCQVLVVK